MPCMSGLNPIPVAEAPPYWAQEFDDYCAVMGSHLAAVDSNRSQAMCTSPTDNVYIAALEEQLKLSTQQTAAGIVRLQEQMTGLEKGLAVLTSVVSSAVQVMGVAVHLPPDLQLAGLPGHLQAMSGLNSSSAGPSAVTNPTAAAAAPVPAKPQAIAGLNNETLSYRPSDLQRFSPDINGLKDLMYALPSRLPLNRSIPSDCAPH